MRFAAPPTATFSSSRSVSGEDNKSLQSPVSSLQSPEVARMKRSAIRGFLPRLERPVNKLCAGGCCFGVTRSRDGAGRGHGWPHGTEKQYPPDRAKRK